MEDTPFAKPIQALLQLFFGIVFDVVMIYAMPPLVDVWISDGILKAVCYGGVFLIAVVATLVMPYATMTS